MYNESKDANKSCKLAAYVMTTHYCTLSIPVYSRKNPDQLFSYIQKSLSLCKNSIHCRDYIYQVINLDTVRFPETYILAAHYVFYEHMRGRLLLRNKNLEFLLYLSLERNLDKAVEKAGFKPNKWGCLVLVVRDVKDVDCDALHNNVSLILEDMDKRIITYRECSWINCCKRIINEKDKENLLLELSDVTRFYVKNVL